MKLRAMSVLGLFLAAAGTCEGTTEPPPDTCVTGQTLTIGTDIAGAVAQGDCELPNSEGTRGDSYAFTLASQSFVRLNIAGTTETKIRVRDTGKAGDAQEVVLMESGQASYQAFAAPHAACRAHANRARGRHWSDRSSGARHPASAVRTRATPPSAGTGGRST